MARKVDQIIAHGDRRWRIRVYLGRDHETKKRKCQNHTIHGSMQEVQALLTKNLRERDLGREKRCSPTKYPTWFAKARSSSGPRRSALAAESARPSAPARSELE